MNKVDYDKKHATKNADGDITAKNQNGVDVKGRPHKPKGK